MISLSLLLGAQECYLRVYSGGFFRDTENWYQIWAAAVALRGICARQSRSGVARLLGKQRLF